MAILNTLLSTLPLFGAVASEVAKPSGLWEWLLLNVFSFVKSYGLRIIVFLVILKLILLPLDLFQRYKMRKNTKITEALKPQVDKLKAQYAGDPKMLSAKQMELNKRAGYSYFSSCIPMILTLVIFITLFNGMRSISQYMIFRQYAAWYDIYTTAIAEYESDDGQYRIELERIQNDIDHYTLLITQAEENDPTNVELIVSYRVAKQTLEAEYSAKLVEAESYAQDKVVEYNKSNADSFLWIKSLWQPDVLWAKPIHASKSAFENSVGNYAKLNKDKGNVGEAQLSDMLAKYDKVTHKLVESDDNKQNGLMILVILSFLLSVGSQFITQRLQKKSGQLDVGNAALGGGAVKMMMFLMPAVIAYFAMQYTAAFALYMVANSAMTILINVSTTLFMNFYDNRERIKAKDVIVSYGRPDPNSKNNKSNKR